MVLQLKIRSVHAEQSKADTAIFLLLSMALFIGGMLLIYKLIFWKPTTSTRHFLLFSAFALAVSVLLFFIRSRPTGLVKRSLAVQNQLKYCSLFTALLALIFLSLYWSAITFVVFYLGASAWLVSLRSLFVTLDQLNIIARVKPPRQ